MDVYRGVRGMASKEIEIYLELAEEQLKDAEIAIKNDRYALCALMSALSAENASSALVISLGGRPSKKHRNSLVLYRLSEEADKAIKARIKNIIDLLKDLEHHITISRYPIRKGTALLPPQKLYTREDAANLLSSAKEILNRVKALIPSPEK